jgi:hypothetical protein
MRFDVAAPHRGSTLRAPLRYVQNTSVPRHCCVLNQDGDIIDERTVTNHRECLRRLSQKHPGARIAMEVGSHSPWIKRFLTELGHEVFVANLRKLRDNLARQWVDIISSVSFTPNSLGVALSSPNSACFA